jgi:hypothetical protein
VVLSNQKLRRFIEPFITANLRIHRETFYERGDLESGWELGELHQRGEPRVRFGIGNATGTMK